MNRRAFLAASAALLSGCAANRNPAHKDIIDTHTHFYDPTRPEGVPWPPKNDSVLYRPVLPDEFSRIAKQYGIAGTVVVEASPRVEDNQWVLDLARKNRIIVGLVGHLKPGQPFFRDELKRFSANPLFRGIRTGLWGMKLAADNDQFIKDLFELAARGLALDVLASPDEVGLVDQIAAKVPHLPIVIDHCANVRVDGKAPPANWIEGIRKVASRKNVHMKVSGLAEGSGREGSAPADVNFYRPVLDMLWNEFGPDRVIYGSNWPVCTRFADYSTVLEIVREYFGEKGEAISRKYFSLNAQRVYKFLSGA